MEYESGEPVDAELAILENIYGSSDSNVSPRQRDLAQITGASLGMTNAILKRLAKKGWITIRKLNSRNIQYAVTLEGINELVRRSYGYFKRTISNVVSFKDYINQAVAGAKKQGFASVLLIGISDLDFIVEHACDRNGLSFFKVVDVSTASQAIHKSVYTIYAETFPHTTEQGTQECLYLSRMVMKMYPGEE